MRLLLISAVSLVCCFAQQPDKPVCNKKNQGALWPAPGEADACHPVEMCSLDVWKYRWEPVTVDVSQLAKDRKRRPACTDGQQRPRASAERKPHDSN
jgi:hypothetical protein